MKTKIPLTLLGLILFVTIGASQSQRATWEYKLEYKMSEKKANELGAQGWDLAAIESTSGAGLGTNVPVYVFKRQR